jgi:hypothetical protein
MNIGNTMAGKLSIIMTGIFNAVLILVMVTLFVLAASARPVYERVIHHGQE